MRRLFLAALSAASCAPCPDGTILPLWSLSPCPEADTDEIPVLDGTGDLETIEAWDPCPQIADEIAGQTLDNYALQPVVLPAAHDYSVPLTFGGGAHELGILDRSIQWLPVAVLPGEPSYGWQWASGAPAPGATVAIDPVGLEATDEDPGWVWRMELAPPQTLEQIALTEYLSSYSVPWIVVDDYYDHIGYYAGLDADDDGELLLLDAGPWQLVAGAYPQPLEAFATPMEWQLGLSAVIGRASLYQPHTAAPWGADLEEVSDNGVGVIPLAGWCVWTRYYGDGEDDTVGASEP
jgi:hypothetical protein